MGTYYRVRIQANTTSKKLIKKIESIISSCDALDCWNEFGAKSKWLPDELMKELTEKCPNVMFRVDYRGEWSGTEFYRGDKKLSSEYLPKFPTTAQFKIGLANQEIEEKKED